jgi:hypothetical protein
MDSPFRPRCSGYAVTQGTGANFEDALSLRRAAAISGPVLMLMTDCDTKA